MDQLKLINVVVQYETQSDPKKNPSPKCRFIALMRDFNRETSRVPCPFPTAGSAICTKRRTVPKKLQILSFWPASLLCSSFSFDTSCCLKLVTKRMKTQTFLEVSEKLSENNCYMKKKCVFPENANPFSQLAAPNTPGSKLPHVASVLLRSSWKTWQPGGKMASKLSISRHGFQ